MSLNTKIKLFFLLVIAVVAVVGVKYYRIHQRPKYAPPPPRAEINITIIPGWNLRDIAENWKEKGIIKNEEELYDLLGRPAYDYKKNRQSSPVLSLDFPLLTTHPKGISYEGYLFPDTYRIYADAKPEDAFKKIFSNLENKITAEMRTELLKQKKSFFEILTMASLVEREAKTPEDMAMVADIFWRRNKMNWALQSCASVNYITGKNDPGVLDKDRVIDSAYNTYKYPGLPLGPVGNPGLDAIKAAIYPQKNAYWYFMSGTDGVMHYAKTLDEHNINVARYLK